MALFLQSGLTKAVKESKISLQQAEYEFLSFVRQQTPPGLCPLAGKMCSFLIIIIMSSLPQFPAGCWKATWCTWQGCFSFLCRDLTCESKPASRERHHLFCWFPKANIAHCYCRKLWGFFSINVSLYSYNWEGQLNCWEQSVTVKSEQ